MEKLFFKSIFAALLCIFSITGAYATDTYTWVGGSSVWWSDPDNWLYSGWGMTGYDYPGDAAADNVVINHTGNDPINDAGSFSLNNITLDGGGSGCQVDFSGSFIFVSGNIVCTNSSDIIKGFRGNVTGTISGNGELDLSSSSTLKSDISIAKLVGNTGSTCTLFKSGTLTIGSGYSFYNLTISASTLHTGSFSVSHTLTGTGEFIPDASAVITLTGTFSNTNLIFEVTCSGNTDDLGHQYQGFSFSTYTNATINFTGGDQTIGAGTYQRVEASCTSLSATGAVNINSYFYMYTTPFNTNTGSLTLNNATLSMVSGGNFSCTGGTVTFNYSSGTPTIPSGAVFNNLTISAGTVTAVGSFAVNGTFTVSSGATFNPTSDAVISGTGTLTGTGTANVTYTTGSSNHLRAQYAMSTLTLSGLTAAFTGSSAQVITNSVTPGNLTINNRSGVTANTDLTITGNLTLTAGTFTVGSHALSVGGTVSGTSSNLSASNGTVAFTGSSQQTIPSTTYKSITINNSAGAVLGTDVTITGTLTLTNGPLALGTYNLTLSSGSTVSGGSLSAYIQILSTGKVTAKNVSSMTIPVGDEYAPVVISNGGGADYTIGLTNSVTDNGGSPTLTSHAVGITWSIMPSISVSNVSITFQWPGANELTSFVRSSSFAAMRNSTNGTWAPLAAAGPASGSDPYTQAATVSSMTGNTTYYFAVADNVSSLPVTFTDFTAAYRDNTVQLNWTTASEIDNDYFSAERSADGAHWAAIGQIPGHGTSNISNRYTAVDNLAGIAPGNTLYYRLKQVDYNGKFEYSAIRTVRMANTPAAFEIYPNPAADVVHITCGANAEGVIILKNISGQVLYTAKCTQALQTIDISALNKGLYVITLQSGDMVKEQLLIKN